MAVKHTISAMMWFLVDGEWKFQGLDIPKLHTLRVCCKTFTLLMLTLLSVRSALQWRFQMTLLVSCWSVFPGWFAFPVLTWFGFGIGDVPNQAWPAYIWILDFMESTDTSILVKGDFQVIFIFTATSFQNVNVCWFSFPAISCMVIGLWMSTKKYWIVQL